MKRLLAASLLFVGAIWLTCPPPAYSAQNCASLSEKRSNLFHEHAYNLTRIRKIRSQLATMNTVDPAVIDAQLKMFTAAANNARDRRARATPDEKKLFGKLFAAFEDAEEFWRAKKAREETAGVVEVPPARIFTAMLDGNLKSYEGQAEYQSREIEQLDREIQQCKAAQGGGEARQHSNWNGTYVSGPYTIVVSGGFGSLSYTADRNDPSTTDHTSATCTVNGTEATCKETGKYHDSDKDVERTSTVVLTLSGNTILAKAKVTEATVTLSNGQPCPDAAQCTGLHVGAEFSGVWTRKP